jgi:hypothetical protein
VGLPFSVAITQDKICYLDQSDGVLYADSAPEFATSSGYGTETSMTNRDKLAAFLKQRSGTYFCDKCLSGLTGILPPSQVNQITGGLEVARREVQRIPQACSNCGQDRKCIAHVPLKKSNEHPTS